MEDHINLQIDIMRWDGILDKMKKSKKAITVVSNSRLKKLYNEEIGFTFKIHPFRKIFGPIFGGTPFSKEVRKNSAKNIQLVLDKINQQDEQNDLVLALTDKFSPELISIVMYNP